MYEIRDHPDAPDHGELGEFVVEPVSPDVIRDRREAGEDLVEVNLLESDKVDAYVELKPDPMEPGTTDIGTALYRLVQLFGTPQLDEYMAGEDISWRTNETFKYLFQVTREDEAGEWLITVHDSRVRLGVSLATWSDDADGDLPEVDPGEAVSLLSLVTNIVTEPVLCEHKDVPY